MVTSNCLKDGRCRSDQSLKMLQGPAEFIGARAFVLSVTYNYSLVWRCSMSAVCVRDIRIDSLLRINILYRFLVWNQHI